jgi:hypothetical protein
MALSIAKWRVTQDKTGTRDNHKLYGTRAQRSVPYNGAAALTRLRCAQLNRRAVSRRLAERAQNLSAIWCKIKVGSGALSR